MVEYLGMRNLINAVKASVGLRNGKLLFGFEGSFYSMLFSYQIPFICLVPWDIPFLYNKIKVNLLKNKWTGWSWY